jgi:hypothetical protein
MPQKSTEIKISVDFGLRALLITIHFSTGDGGVWVEGKYVSNFLLH